VSDRTEPAVLSEAEIRLRLQREARRFCPPWLRDSAEDIAQIAWMRLDRTRKTSERNRDPGPTLVSKVAYCATVDEMRRHGRRKEFPMDDVPEVVQPSADDPARRVKAEEIGCAIRDCLTHLGDNRCLAVTLFLQGHTAPETGRILGWTLRKTENLIFRGMADMRRCLSAKGMQP
jgi:RNA polymerase sigma-70 factor (ECF subfamily)